MSALWAVEDLSKATGGVATFGSETGKWCAWRVEIDSRKVQAGDIFLALRGERFDGHDYVGEALSRGAIAAIVERKLDIQANQLIVGNCYKALNDLAVYNRARSKAKIIGVTGSVGKTSTKEMLKLALSVHGKTYATSGNYNNHIGTPLNLANMPLDTEFAIFEMGMNHVGEISHLTRIVRPHIAVITGVEAVHIEHFSSIAEIAEAKAEILEGVDVDGVAVINADQPYFDRVVFPKITFGVSEKSSARLCSYRPTISGCEVTADISGTELSYNISATGRHVAIISLSVLAVADHLGLDVKKSADALVNFTDVDGRGRVVKLKIGSANILLINDSYNASPASMQAAFDKTAEIWQLHGRKGRKIALLGDMLELGMAAKGMHIKLAEKLLSDGFNKIYLAGDLMAYLRDNLPKDVLAGYAPSAAGIIPLLGNAFADGDVVLIKGSHGSKMYELANYLIKIENDRECDGKIKNAV